MHCYALKYRRNILHINGYICVRATSHAMFSHVMLRHAKFISVLSCVFCRIMSSLVCMLLASVSADGTLCLHNLGDMHIGILCQTDLFHGQ